MADLTLNRTHRLGGDELRRRVEGLAQKLLTRYGGQYEWRDSAVHYQRGGGVSAVILCAPESIRIDVTLGPLMGFLRPTIERELIAALDDQLAV